MIGLLQRVTRASVRVDEALIGEIGTGILVLVGFERQDQAGRLDRFLERLLNYRVFADPEGRMNRSLRDIDGDLLLVPQFTLAADTNSGNRPSFTPAAPPALGQALFDALVERARLAWPQVQTGRFGANMQVELVNDGPVTFSIQVN